jgi:RNA polymerase sigma-70 factor (ECF subfamily)
MWSSLNWEELYERCAPAVYRRALGFVRHEADAWDLTHEVFRKVVESPPVLRGRTRPMTYLYQVTTNVALNWLRAQRVRSGSPELDEVEHVTEPESAAEARNLITALMRRLDDVALQIAVLHFMDGLSQEEIAEVVGLSRKTVGLRLAMVRRVASELAGRAA